jgi:uncharacterized protein (DUF849 family)
MTTEGGTPGSVAIAVAPNGGRWSKKDHPALPITPGELAKTAVDAAAAGAAMIHVHVRDQDGRHLLDADAYRVAIAAIRQAVGDRLVIQITSEALGIYQPAEQMAVALAVRPEAVSLALRELAPESVDEPRLAAFLLKLRTEGIAPQIILYEPEEACRLARLLGEAGLAPENIPVLYVLGRYKPGQRSEPADLLPFLAAGMPRFHHAMVCAFGARELACVTAAALLGCHMRVGFENNFFLPDGRRAPDNAALVAAAAAALCTFGLKPTSAAALRAAWRIG